MKKIKYLLIISCFFFLNIFNANAANKLNDLRINITLDTNGNGHVVEEWNMTTNSDTEIYKEMYNLGNMKITNFKVKDENREYIYNGNWDIHDSFNDKQYKYGINHADEGIELCWGISEYKNKTYTISYDIQNLVYLTDDAQVLYSRLVNDLTFPPKKFSVTITGPNPFPDTLDVWGYGYKGYAYVKDGKISMSNEENTKLSNGNYAVLLVKFPIGTFNIDSSNTYTKYQNFKDVYDAAEKGTFSYNYNVTTIIKTITKIIKTLIPFIIIALGIFFGTQSSKYKFGEAGSKINIKEINNFRDIPCNKNVFKAYFLAQAYKLNKKNTDFLGTLFLKWAFEKKIEILTTDKKKLIGTKEEQNIVLKEKVTFDNDIEEDLFDMLRAASKDGILESKELERWCKVNYSKFFKWFDKAEEYGRDLYVQEGKVVKDKFKYLINDSLKEEAIKLAGLKKFLIEFSRIKEKSSLEVVLWKEYLMFAQIFGIADKVAEQFKELYPEVVTEMNNSHINMYDIILINRLTATSVVSATSARSAAQSYSSGGGGFSSGGGGFGSFGGGGGGSR